MLPTAPATTCSSRGRPTTAGCRREPSPALRDRGQQPHRAAEALPVAVRAAPRARAVLRARPARPGRAAARRGRPTSRCWSSTAATARGRGRHPDDLRRRTRSTWSAGTAASTPTRSTSRTSCRSPARCTSRRRCTRSSRATTSWSATSCPRKVDYHPQSIPVPYYHSNVDSDEVMFYVGGDYEARKGSGINIGSISLHPGGYAHGPQPARRGLDRRGVLRRARGHGRHLPARSSSARPASPPRTRRTPGPGPAAAPRHGDGDGGPAVFSNG